MSESQATLESLSFDELKDVATDRLHERRSIGPPAELRAEESHIEWLIEEFRKGSLALRDRMSEALRQLLTSQFANWDPLPRSNLLDVLQECGGQLKDDLYRLVRSKTFFSSYGPEAHAGLLKCLISLDRKVSPDFWLDQFYILGPKYGALILSGLVQHGLSMGISFLPELVADQTAAREIRLALPVLEDMFGREDLNRELQRYLPKCSQAARELLILARPVEHVPPRLEPLFEGLEDRRPAKKKWAKEDAHTPLDDLLVGAS